MSANSPILIFGAQGQVGRALVELLGDEAVGLSRQEADLSNPDSLLPLMLQHQPKAIINAAAYTAVDKAEEEEELATIINAQSPAVMARYAQEHAIPFIHYSTDYVFEGTGDTPRSENEPTHPIGAYGRSKLAGEEYINAIGGDYLIFRTSWVYDAWGKNFLNTMLRLGKEKETLNIINDQIGAPTYAPHLAQATIKALRYTMGKHPFPSGTYHLCGKGETSWYGFAEAIFDKLRTLDVTLKIQYLNPIATSDYPTPAKRPLNSRLNCEKAQHNLGVTMPGWETGLTECLALIKVKLTDSAIQ